MTNKQRFVYLRLQELSANATEEQMNAVQIAAEQLFDKQKELADQFNLMEAIAKRAAENIQDAFADFLFDPFEDGVRGMLLAFVNAIRRMIAEILAAQTIQAFANFFGIALPSGVGTGGGGGGGGGGGKGGPKAAAGGPALAGRPMLVGERGPELFIPDSSGRIVNNSATRAMGGGMQFTTNIDARGADPSLIARLPQIFETRDRRLMMKMKELVETGAVTL